MQSDCDRSSFCGAGHCRPREGTGELLTFCLEELWYEGEFDPPLSGQMILSNGWDSATTHPREPFPRRSITSPDGEDCRLVTRSCERFPARTFSIDSYSNRGFVASGQQECFQSTAIHELFSSFGDDEGKRPIPDFLDQGCVQLPMHDEGASIWISVWYP